MSTENNVKVVKNFFAAIGRGDKQAPLALVADGSRHQDPGRQAGDTPRVNRHASHGVAARMGRVGAGTAKPHRSGLAGRLATP